METAYAQIENPHSQAGTNRQTGTDYFFGEQAKYLLPLVMFHCYCIVDYVRQARNIATRVHDITWETLREHSLDSIQDAAKARNAEQKEKEREERESAAQSHPDAAAAAIGVGGGRPVHPAAAVEGGVDHPHSFNWGI